MFNLKAAADGENQPARQPQRGGTAAARVYTGAEIQNMLKGFVEVPRPQWPSIPLNTMARYMRDDGKFVKGGYISLHGVYPDGNMYLTFQSKLGAGGGPSYKMWQVAYSSIARIWVAEQAVRPPGGGDIPGKRLKEIHDAINKLVATVKEQNARIAVLEEEAKNMRSDHKKFLAVLGKFSPRGKP